MHDLNTTAPTASAAAAGRRPVTGAALAGIGRALPTRSVTNDELGLEVGDEWIFSRTGIRSRRVLDPEESLVDLAAVASRDALADAGVSASELDLILLSTATPDLLMPNCASQVAAQLGTPAAGAVDVNGACAGWVQALALAAAMVECGRARTVLVGAAERNARMTHVDPSRNQPLFGDGAGAAVVCAVDGPSRIHPVLMGNDGASGHLMTLGYADDGFPMLMDGPGIFEHVVRDLVRGSRAALDAAGLGLDDIDLFAFHQGNARITRLARERLGLTGDPRVVEAVQELGNIGSASIPQVLVEARRQGRLGAGSKVLLGTVGAGMHWSAGVVEWGRSDG